jgi:hypothetical protein
MEHFIVTYYDQIVVNDMPIPESLELRGESHNGGMATPTSTSSRATPTATPSTTTIHGLFH